MTLVITQALTSHTVENVRNSVNTWFKYSRFEGPSQFFQKKFLL